MKRGALIVIEGLDRTGKSTQCHALDSKGNNKRTINDLIRRSLATASIPAVLEPASLHRDNGKRPDGATLVPWKLVESLMQNQIKAKYTNFPARNTEIGKVINSYLTSKKELPDKAIHLLFSANRWECVHELVKTLEEGTSVIVDRYCYSGVAFSAAKGIDINWCKASDCGLPAPDKVFFLTMPLESIQQRNGFGKERYEVYSFQAKVSDMYHQLKEDHWDVLDARRTVEEIQKEILEKTIDIVQNVGDKPISKVWTKC